MAIDPTFSSEANPAAARRWSAWQIVLIVLSSLCAACCLGAGGIVGFVWLEYHRYHQRQIDLVANDKPIETSVEAMRNGYVNNRLQFETMHNGKVIQLDGKVAEISETHIRIRDHAPKAPLDAFCYFDDPTVPPKFERGERVVVKGYFGSMGRTALGLALKLQLTHCQVIAAK